MDLTHCYVIDGNCREGTPNGAAGTSDGEIIADLAHRSVPPHRSSSENNKSRRGNSALRPDASHRLVASAVINSCGTVLLLLNRTVAAHPRLSVQERLNALLTKRLQETRLIGSLNGTRVVELSTMITGPLAGMLLGDLGADVIKVESPDGDPFRAFRGGSYSPHFCSYNRNKRSIRLNLRSRGGKLAMRKLLQTADVFLANTRPGALDRLGFSDSVLHDLNPQLILCEINGFGTTGPYAARPAYDAVTQAVSGMSSLFVDPLAPQLVGPTISDNATGHYACYGILGALVERERTGRAQRVDVNMLEATIAFMPDPFGYYTQLNQISDPHLRPHTSQSYAFVCSDRKLITVHLSSQEKFWVAFVDALGSDGLRNHPDFETRASRIEHYESIRKQAAEILIAHPRSYWMHKFAEHDLPFAPIHDIAEVFNDPQVRHLDTFQELEHKAAGRVTAIRRPVLFNRQREDQPCVPPPLLGEHTREILGEIGLDPTVLDTE